ncbi:MAG: putative zinc-binding protein [Fimbriimonas sp.]|nr:putative zinc-binding protein [Fimbriimonas sp.]
MSCCGTKDTMLLTCSGGCNVGQIANDAARGMDSLGQGKMYCAVGVASAMTSFIETARKAEVRVAIDGCEVGCVKKALDEAGLSTEVHVVVTDLGVEKAHRFDYSMDQVGAVMDAVARAVAMR